MLSIVAALTATWALAISARVADRVPSAAVSDVSRLDDSAAALRRVPAVVAGVLALAAIGTAVLGVAFVPLVLTLTEAGALLIEALARSNDQQLAGAIIFLLTASIVFLNFITDIALALFDPRVRRGLIG